MKKLLITAFALLLAATFTACDNHDGHLSRDEAKSQVSSSIAFSLMQPSLIAQVGHVSSRCGIEPDRDVEFVILQKLGFLAIRSVGNQSWDVSLTDSGKRALHDGPYAHTTQFGCDHSQVSFDLAKAANPEITGIREDGPTRATVEYRFAWEPTDVGTKITESALADLHLSQFQMTEIKGLLAGRGALLPDNKWDGDSASAMFVKYDDGWRLKQ